MWKPWKWWSSVRTRKSSRPRKQAGQRRLGVESLEGRQMLSVLVSPTRGLLTSESGGYAIVNVVLRKAPTANVVVRLRSDNIKEGKVSASGLLFTPANWNKVQSFRVTGQPDGVGDGDKVYHVITAATSTDAYYNGIAVPDITLTNKDNRQVAGLLVKPTTAQVTSETGAVARFTVQLTSKPAAEVRVPVRSSNRLEGVVSTNQLIFTPANWNAPQTVTVRGVADNVIDGDKNYLVRVGACISTDAAYNGRHVRDVALVNRDIDQVRLYDGTYQGSYSGTATYAGMTSPVSGPVLFTVANGKVTVTQPGAGSGTVSQNGATQIGVTSGSVQGAVFGGTFAMSGGKMRASGGWSFNQGGAAGHGTWSAVRL